MHLIDKDKLIRDLTVLQPYNNKDVPQWVWDVINGQAEVRNVVRVPDNLILDDCVERRKATHDE